MGYWLGIDLGTSFSSAAVQLRGDARLVTLGAHSASIPSAVLTRPDGDVLVGDSAVEVGAGEPARLARGFTSRIGAADPVMVGGAPVSAEALTGRLLAGILEKVIAAEDSSPDRICLTHPPNWSPYQIDLFGQAITMAGLGRDDVLLVSGPVAAALGAARAEPVAPGELMAVLDIGATSTRASVLRGTEGGFETAAPTEQVDGVGGLAFDTLIFDLVNRALDQIFDRLDRSRPGMAEAMFQAELGCIRAKEALSYRNSVRVSIVLPDTAEEVDLSVGQFDQLLRPRLAGCVAALRRVLAGAGDDPDGPTRIVVVGGSARIPLVARFLGAELGRPVQIGPDPQHLAAIGAVLHAVRCPAGGESFDATAPVPVGVARNRVIAPDAEDPSPPAEAARIAAAVSIAAAASGPVGIAAVPPMPGEEDRTAPNPITQVPSGVDATAPTPITQAPTIADATAPTPIVHRQTSDTPTLATAPPMPGEEDRTAPNPITHVPSLDDSPPTVPAPPMPGEEDRTAPNPITQVPSGVETPAPVPPVPDRSSRPAPHAADDGDSAITGLAPAAVPGDIDPTRPGVASPVADPIGTDPTIQTPAVTPRHSGGTTRSEESAPHGSVDLDATTRLDDVIALAAGFGTAPIPDAGDTTMTLPDAADGPAVFGWPGAGSADPTSVLDTEALASYAGASGFDPGAPLLEQGHDTWQHHPGQSGFDPGAPPVEQGHDTWQHHPGQSDDRPADGFSPVGILGNGHDPEPSAPNDAFGWEMTETQLHRAVGRSHRWEDPIDSQRRTLPPAGILVGAGCALLILLIVAGMLLRGGDDTSTGGALTTNSTSEEDLVRADEEQGATENGAVGLTPTPDGTNDPGQPLDEADPGNVEEDEDTDSTSSPGDQPGNSPVVPQTTTTAQAVTTASAVTTTISSQSTTTAPPRTTTTRAPDTTLSPTSTEPPPTSSTPPEDDDAAIG